MLKRPPFRSKLNYFDVCEKKRLDAGQCELLLYSSYYIGRIKPRPNLKTPSILQPPDKTVRKAIAGR